MKQGVFRPFRLAQQRISTRGDTPSSRKCHGRFYSTDQAQETLCRLPAIRPRERISDERLLDCVQRGSWVVFP